MEHCYKDYMVLTLMQLHDPNSKTDSITATGNKGHNVAKNVK